jgi:hypothetical protein
VPLPARNVDGLLNNDRSVSDDYVEDLYGRTDQPNNPVKVGTLYPAGELNCPQEHSMRAALRWVLGVCDVALRLDRNLPVRTVPSPLHL